MYLNSCQIQLHQLQTVSKAEKNGFDITKLIFQNVCTVCLCGAVVKELLARADLPGSTPGGSVFCFFGPFLFSVQSLFFNTIFPFGLFSFILTSDPADDHALGSICSLSLSLEFYFGKGISRTL